MHYKWSDVLMKWKGIALLILLSLLFHLPAKSQVSTALVIYGFKQDTVAVNAGQTFSNLLWIENKSSEPVGLIQVLALGQKRIGLLKLPDTILLAAGQKRWFPLKYIADRQTIQNFFQEFKIQLKGIGIENVQQSAFFYTQLNENQGLVLDVDQAEVYLNQATNQARIMLRCYNNSLIPVNFRLELTEVPDGLEFIGEKSTLTLESGTQETLPFIAKSKYNRAAVDYTVLIRALDVSGKVIALRRLRIMSVASDRRLSLNQTPFLQDYPNTIALRYMTFDNSLSSYQIQGNSKYKFANGTEFSYQINTDYFNNAQQSGLNVSNSFVEYEAKSWSVKAGSIYESLDFNLNGRGIKGTVKLGEHQVLSAYGLERNYLLYSDFNNVNTGNTIALAYTQAEPEGGNKNAVILYDRNLLTGVNTMLMSGLINFRLTDKQTLGVESGYSVQHFRQYTNQHNGVAIGLNYSLNLQGINIYSNNYYSTPWYGGLRRGLLQLENLLTVRLDKDNSLGGRFSLMNSQLKVFNGGNPIILTTADQYGNVTYELTYTSRLRHGSINLKPYYFYQYMQISNSGNWKSASMRAKINLIYSHMNHDFSVDLDNGYTFRNTSERPPSPFFSSKVNMSYRNRYIGFSAYGQYNSYYLSDVLAMPGVSKYFSYSFGPNTRFMGFRDRLMVNMNTVYSYVGFNRSNSYSVTSNFKWQLKREWAISMDAFYSFNKQTSAYNPLAMGEFQSEYTQNYSSRQFRFGLEKKFGSKGSAESKKLELVYFEDWNGNGYHDKGEPYASEILVKIGGVAALTNSKGEVKFLGAKDKKYEITIINDKGWSATDGTAVFLSKNIRLEIPLVKTERLTGKLTYVADKYNESVPSSSGLRVKAVAENGKVYSTVTNDEGDFSFYLPENKYSVYVETEGMPYSMLNPKEIVEIKRNKVQSLEFKYKYQRRKVDVVKFK